MVTKKHIQMNEKQTVSKWASGEISTSEFHDNLTRIVQKRYKHLINRKKVERGE